MGIADIIDWSIALVPVLVLTAVFIWLDVFKLMSLWETLGLLLMGGHRRRRRLSIERRLSRYPADWLQQLQPLRRAVDRGGAEGDRDHQPVPVQPHRLQARRRHFRIRRRRRLLGRREYFLSDALSRLAGGGVDGARPGHRGDARHDAGDHGRDRPRLSERETRGAASEYDFNPLWFVPGSPCRGRHPHLVQPVPGTANAGHAGHGDHRAAGADGHFPLRRRRGPAVADGRAQRPPARCSTR